MPVLAMAVIALGLGAVTTSARAAACPSRILVLSAYPEEVDAVMARATWVDPVAVVVGDRSFYLGSLGGHDVVMAMTRIGLVNAQEATEAALTHFTCASAGTTISAVVFSGVAGGTAPAAIGDVMVPDRWTMDDGATFSRVDRRLFATARRVAESGTVHLAHVTPAGDPACVCINPSTVQTVDLGYETKLVVGGAGQSTDQNGGKAFPCVPGGGDTFGCAPCRFTTSSAPSDVAAFLGTDPAVLFSNASGAPDSGAGYLAVDQETAAAQAVANAHHVPFLAFRGVSDGPGDKLGLPGFPFQFFVYKELAAQNAATMTTAFLAALPVERGWPMATPGAAGPQSVTRP